MGGLCGCIKRSVKRFYFVVFIHHCKTVIKADQTSSFYPSINDILYQNYVKRQCHCDNVALSEPTKTNKQKAHILHSRVHPVSSFSPRISSLHTFGRKQVVNDFFASQPCTTESTAQFSQRLYFRFVTDMHLLSCDLDASI